MANDFFDALNQVVRPDFRILPDGQNRLIISEEQNQGQDGRGERVILKRKGRVFVMSLDQSWLDVFPFFTNTTPGIKKRNDAILFCQDGNQSYVFIMELKSGNPKDGIVQLKSGRNFVEYLLKTIQLHFNKQHDWEYRYIIFSTSRRSAAKRPTKRLQKAPEMIDGLEVYLEKCNQMHAIEEFFQPEGTLG